LLDSGFTVTGSLGSLSGLIYICCGGQGIARNDSLHDLQIERLHYYRLVDGQTIVQACSFFLYDGGWQSLAGLVRAKVVPTGQFWLLDLWLEKSGGLGIVWTV